MVNGFVDMHVYVICTHLQAHFQSTFRIRVHKNLCTPTCTPTPARTLTTGLLSRVIIPRFSFEIDEKYNLYTQHYLFY